MDTAGKKIDKSVQELKESGEIEGLLNENTPEEEKAEVAAPASPVKKIRPQTPVSSADYEKKEK